MSGAQVTGAVILVIIFGGFALAIWHGWHNDRNREAESEFRARFEPNRDGDLTPHTHPDQVHEYPPVPADHRTWKAGR